MAMQKITKSISVFLPIYNEAAIITATISAIDAYLKERFEDYEILAVNDGSADETANIILALSQMNNRVKLINHQVNLGYAQALRTGFAHSRKELIFYTDADRQFDIAEMDKMLPFLEDCDIVTGFRIKRCDPLLRIWLGKIYNWFYRLVFNLSLKDIDCAFKLYKREVFQKINWRQDLSSGVINAEIFLKALNNGFKIKEIGINHYPRIMGVSRNALGQSGKIGLVKPRVIWGFLIDTLKLWQEIKLK